MKIKLITIGKTNQSYFIEAENEYLNRLKHYNSIEYIQISDLKNQKNLSISEIKKLEGDKILSYIDSEEHIYLLDDKGKSYTSKDFATFIEHHQKYSSKSLIFIIGGAFGFSDQIYKRSKGKISLSSLTFSHQMVRMIFLEQLYRAFTIIKGEKYHHE